MKKIRMHFQKSCPKCGSKEWKSDIGAVTMGKCDRCGEVFTTIGIILGSTTKAEVHNEEDCTA